MFAIYIYISNLTYIKYISNYRAYPNYPKLHCTCKYSD